jgi:ribosomal protein S21
MLKDGVFQEMKRRAYHEKAIGQAEAQVGHGAQAAAAR